MFHEFWAVLQCPHSAAGPDRGFYPRPTVLADVNPTMTIAPLAPFGGFGHSGIGCEYGSYGLREFCEPKSLQY